LSELQSESIEGLRFVPPSIRHFDRRRSRSGETRG
jgi:hypothetical protein